MNILERITVSIVAAVAIATAAAPALGQEMKLRIAEADNLSGEDLVQLIAYENARERGVDIEVVVLKSDDVTFQAVLNGDADIGVGVAYSQIQTLNAPIRHFYQVRQLAYYPVVDTASYDSWEDLNGEPFVVHARGSGTEAMAMLMERENNIKFGQMSYVPGSEVRVTGMQRGNIKATLLDLPSTQALLQSDPERFKVLPIPEIPASDSAYYARTEFLNEQEEAVQILIEELIKAARAINENPAHAAAERERLGLLSDLPPELLQDITPYFTQMAEVGLFPEDGGGEAAARTDVEFLAASGGLEGDPASLAVEDFWDLDPLKAALQAVGG